MADLLALTGELVNIGSVSFEERALVDWLESDLRNQKHLNVVRVGDNLVARTELGHGERVMLAGHSDTVPSTGQSEQAIFHDGGLSGLGAVDMKGGLAVFVELARNITTPNVDLTYVFYAREEVAFEHSGLKELAEHDLNLLQADCAILGEPTDAAVEAGCQGTIRAEITLAGRSAHTARPWMGVNAIHRLAAILERLNQYEPRTPIIDGCQYREAVQAVHVAGGVAGNVVPNSAALRVHHRYAPDRTHDQAEAYLRSLFDGALNDDDTFEVIDAAPAALPSLENGFLNKLASSSGLEVRAKLGWTDAGRLSELGIPATNFGPGDPTLAHTADEFVSRESLERTYEVLAQVLQD